MKTLLAFGVFAAALMTGCPTTGAHSTSGTSGGPFVAAMCAPCLHDADCGSPLGSGYCVDDNNGTSYCGPTCSSTAACAEGGVCIAAGAFPDGGGALCYPPSMTCVGYQPTGAATSGATSTGGSTGNATLSTGMTAATSSTSSTGQATSGSGTAGTTTTSSSTTSSSTATTSTSTSTGATTTHSSSTSTSTSTSTSSSSGGTGGTPLTCGTPGSYNMTSAVCGTERWSVKTGTDVNANSVNLTPVPDTIQHLAGLPTPPTLPETSRIAPTELQAVILTNVEVDEIKAESDNDYHLVLNDGTGHTMIGEVPYPGCVGMGSPFACLITHARGEVDAIGTTSSTNFATIIGVPFFDVAHGQTGLAPNAIELHPILSICFGQGCTVRTSYLRLRDHQDDQFQWVMPPPFQQIPATWLTGVVDDEEEEKDDELGGDRWRGASTASAPDDEEPARRSVK